MNEKFTKGPWTICWTTYFHWNSADIRRTNFSITASPYGSVRPIAESKWKAADWSKIEDEELVANAHLIAAAPELFEVLQACMNMIEGDGIPPNWDWIREVRRKALGTNAARGDNQETGS